MGEHREQSEPVVDDDGVAREIQLARDDDAAGIRRLNRRAARTQEIGATMRVARLAVEDAARAEGAVRGLRHRPHERLGPSPLAGRCGPYALEQARFARE